MPGRRKAGGDKRSAEPRLNEAAEPRLSEAAEPAAPETAAPEAAVTGNGRPEAEPAGGRSASISPRSRRKRRRISARWPAT